MINTNPTKGMRDLTPKEVELRNFVKNTIFNVYKKYGFTEIETPCTEDINLLSGGNGGDNEKMLFKILKRGEKLNLENVAAENDLVDLGLRYDLTVPLCRFYANNRAKLPTNFKVIQIGSVWRAEKPQKGRFRQFTQCDIDIIGTKGVAAEIELILATSEALVNLGFENFKIRLNDRRILEYFASFCNFGKSTYERVFIILDKLDKIGLIGVETELSDAGLPSSSIKKFLSILEKSVVHELTIEELEALLPGIEYETLQGIALVMNTVNSLSDSKFSVKLDLSLVRGMGYYTGQIFEIEAENYKSSIAGGGRYDKLIGKFLKGNDSIPACGFSIGFERVISILESQNFSVLTDRKKIAVLHDDNLLVISDLLSKAKILRERGDFVSLEVKSKNFSKQLENLINQGFNSYWIYNSSNPIEIKPLVSKIPI